MTGCICFFNLSLALGFSHAWAVTNPDQISVFFPALEGPGNLGRNVSTVLSLQLAQTTRRYPWPENPQRHEFGEGIIRYSVLPLEQLNHKTSTEVAERRDLRAQMTVWGRTYFYGDDVIAEVNITLPQYRIAPSFSCAKTDTLKCDYRQKNFEIWHITRDETLMNPCSSLMCLEGVSVFRLSCLNPKWLSSLVKLPVSPSTIKLAVGHRLVLPIHNSVL
jgi:hypothetical protein